MKLEHINWSDVESVKRWMVNSGWTGHSLVKYANRPNYNIIHTEREWSLLDYSLGDKVIWRS